MNPEYKPPEKCSNLENLPWYNIFWNLNYPLPVPLLWLLPCEKNTSPFHCFLQIFSISRVLYVSCKKNMPASEFTSQLKTAFRFSKVRIPRTFIDKRLNSLLCAILPEWVGPNLVGKISQHNYSSLTLKEILHWHAAIPLNNRNWEADNHENENKNKNKRVQPLNNDTNN